jgi:hypothetical protein
VEPLPFELSVSPYLYRALSISSASILPDAERDSSVDLTALRDALMAIGFNRSWLPLNQIETETFPSLSLDILPYARMLAHRDKAIRERTATTLRLVSLEARRLSRRSFAAQNIELETPYLGNSDLDEVLATAPLWYY